MKKARIAVLVSGGGTNLQALIDAQMRNELGGGEIVAVISSKEGAYALERGAKVGIPGYVIPRKQFASNREMTVALVAKLKELEIDMKTLEPDMMVEALLASAYLFPIFKNEKSPVIQTGAFGKKWVR